MKALRRAAILTAAAICLLSPLPEQTAVAEARFVILTEDTEKETAEPKKNEELIEQIRSTYKKAKKVSHVKSFKGKCGKYVSRQLVLLGINTKYIGCNGNRAFDTYRDKSETSGGFRITAYAAKQYTLREALEAIAKEDPHARNILVGFEKGTSKAGKRYGHVMFIHGIEDGMVYFSDSYAQTVEGKRYKEGEPIVCSIATFVKLYRKYQFDGVIHFG